MANICEGALVARGSKRNLKNFVNFLTDETGRHFARLTITPRKKDITITKNNDYTFSTDVIYFDCAWAASTCMLLGQGYITESEDYLISLEEVCKLYHISCEVFAEEPGNAFSEHFLVDKKGNLKVQEECAFHEYVSDDDEIIREGGFEWEFEL